MLLASIICIANTVYLEARGEGYEGMKMVADVIMTRAERRKMTPCEVVQEANQFAYVSDLVPQEIEPWRLSIAAAIESYFRLTPRLTADHFHTIDVNPNWGFTVVARSGNHIFYDSRI